MPCVGERRQAGRVDVAGCYFVPGRVEAADVTGLTGDLRGLGCTDTEVIVVGNLRGHLDDADLVVTESRRGASAGREHGDAGAAGEARVRAAGRLVEIRGQQYLFDGDFVTVVRGSGIVRQVGIVGRVGIVVIIGDTVVVQVVCGLPQQRGDVSREVRTGTREYTTCSAAGRRVAGCGHVKGKRTDDEAVTAAQHLLTRWQQSVSGVQLDLADVVILHRERRRVVGRITEVHVDPRVGWHGCVRIGRDADAAKGHGIDRASSRVLALESNVDHV